MKHSWFEHVRLSFVCVLIACSSLIASAQSPQSRARSKAGTLLQPRLYAPRLVWQAILAGKETVRIAGTGDRRIGVLAEPRPQMDNGVYIPHPIQLLAFDVKSGAVAWRKEILGGDPTTVADDSGLHIRMQLPLVSYDVFDYKSDDLKYEIITFRWSDGRMGWHVPCSGRGNMIAWQNHLFFDGRTGNARDNELACIDGETGNEQWRTTRSEINGLVAANGALYAYDESRDSDGEYLHAIDPETGKNVQRLLLYPLYRPTTHLGALAWLPQKKVLVSAIEQNTTPGINVYQIRALDAAGKPVWDCSDAGRFQLVNNVLVCQRYTLGEYPHGIIALDPATGHKIWLRSDITNNAGNMDINFGEWHGQAVVLQGNQLYGLNSRTGKTVWILPMPVGEAYKIRQVKIVGDVIIVATDGTKNRPAQVNAYSLR